MEGLDILKYYWQFCRWEDFISKYDQKFCRWEDLISGEPARFLKWTPGQPNGLHYQVKSNKMFDLQINLFGALINPSKRIV